MNTIKEMMNMKLNERFAVADYTTVVRVPGGWMYLSKSGSHADAYTTSIFVPEPVELKTYQPSPRRERYTSSIEKKLELIKEHISNFHGSRGTVYEDELGYAPEDYIKRIENVLKK